jgi:hypothetical protein
MLETMPGLNRRRRQELRAALDVIAGLNRRWLQDRWAGLGWRRRRCRAVAPLFRRQSRDLEAGAAAGSLPAARHQGRRGATL